MKLRTIWTLRYLPFKERLDRTGEWFLRGLAHRLPARLAFYSFIDSGVRAIRDDEEVPAALFTDMLQRHHGAPR